MILGGVIHLMVVLALFVWLKAQPSLIVLFLLALLNVTVVTGSSVAVLSLTAKIKSLINITI
jgi:hypothetical protein